MENKKFDINDDDVKIVGLLNLFFKKLYEEVFSGKSWKFVHSTSANMMVIVLKNISHQLFKHDDDFLKESFHFIDQISSYVKEELIEDNNLIEKNKTHKH